MQVITTQTEVFPFSELSDAAKEKAREWYRAGDSFDYDFCIDNAKTIGALMGFDIDRVYFSGFSSQGDGACFVGSLRYAKGCAKAVKEHAPADTELHAIAEAWQKLQKENFYALRATVKHRGRYSHENCTTFECEDTRNNHGYLENSDTEDAIEEIARDFMRWIYKNLKYEYDYQHSDDVVSENIMANAYQFTADGSIFH